MERKAVLVVERDRDVREVIEAVLKETLDVRVIPVAGFDDALEQLQKVELALVLVHVHVDFRYCSGLDLVRQVKTPTSARAVPVIALVHTSDEREAALKAGSDAVIYEPFDADALLSLVRRYLTLS